MTAIEQVKSDYEDAIALVLGVEGSSLTKTKIHNLPESILQRATVIAQMLQRERLNEQRDKWAATFYQLHEYQLNNK